MLFKLANINLTQDIPMCY